jgi:uncharacterized membrane protein
MEPSINVILLWILFGGAHVGLATRRVRTVLVHRLGEWGFIGLFSVVAVATFSALVHHFAVHRFEGMAGPALGAIPLLSWALLCIASFGAMVMALSLFDYPVSAYALTRKQSPNEPRPIERITRHGFFSGLFLLAIAHALLSSRLIGTVFFACLALFTWLGSVHQDTKLLSLRGDVHRRYMEVTSFLPFAAIVAGRQQLKLRGIPLPAILACIAVPWLLRTFHDSIFAAAGAYVIGATVAGAAIASFQAWRAQRKSAARAVASSAERYFSDESRRS